MSKKEDKVTLEDLYWATLSKNDIIRVLKDNCTKNMVLEKQLAKMKEDYEQLDLSTGYYISDLKEELAEKEKEIESYKQGINEAIKIYSDEFVEKDKELKELRYCVKKANQDKIDYAVEQINELKNMLADRAELIDCEQVAEFMFTVYDLQMCSKQLITEIKEGK